MTISTELEAHILRYYHAEKWKVGTIASHLHVHRSVVERVLSKTGVAESTYRKQPSMIDTYLPFILQTLEKFPTLTASRLYHMAKGRGYPGQESHFRHMIALHRPKKASEAYLRLKTLPGEQSQVDWGHFGHLQIGKAKRPLMAFVMVLSFSRKIFLQFYLNAQMANFLRGHVEAFDYFGGVPRVCLYDNLASAVLDRQGDAIRFNPTLLDFAGYYRYEPRPVAVARGNEKGRVERAIRYIRDHFFAARSYVDINDLNNQAIHWCNEAASNRPCPEENGITVQEAWRQEKPLLIALPSNPYPTQERVEAAVGKTPYVRFDLNDYSVPHRHIRKTVTVLADLKTVRIIDGKDVLATHARSFDKGMQIEEAEHIQKLVEAKQKARLHRGQDRLITSIPQISTLLKRCAEKGYNLNAINKQLVELLDSYGQAELTVAVTESLAKGSVHYNAIRFILERRRHERNEPPPIPVQLPEDRRVRDVVIQSHSLSTYDALQFPDEQHDEPSKAVETTIETNTTREK